MNRPIITLLGAHETAEQVVTLRAFLAAEGYELVGIVDPSQPAEVTVIDDIFIIRSASMAAQICRSATFRYCDTVIHSNALESPKWMRQKS